MTRQELLVALDTSLATQKDLLSRVKSATAPEEKNKFKSAFEVEDGRYLTLKADLDELDFIDQRKSAIDVARKALTPEMAGKTLNPPDQPGARDRVETPNDPIKDLIEKKSFFMRYVRDGGVSLSGQARESIAAKNPRFTATDAVAIPPSIIFAITNGKTVPQALDFLLGKTMLSTDLTGGATDSGAGNLVAPNFIPTVLQKPVDDMNLVNFVRVIQARNGRASYPMLDQSQGLFGGVAFTWKSAEGIDKGETEPSFIDFSIMTNELSGWTEMSIQALNRSEIGLERFLIDDLFRPAVMQEFSRVILVGNGTYQPLGILDGTASPTLVPRITVGEITYADIIRMKYAIRKPERANARFVISDDAEGFLAAQVDGTDRPLFSQDTSLGMRERLIGYPYETHLYGDGGAIGVADAGAVIFGNWQNYLFAIEDEMAIARSDHAEFKAGKIVFRLMSLVGGKPIFDSSFAVLKAETT